MQKFIINFICLLVVSTSLLAQVDRSKAPSPGPAPTISLGEYESFELANGLKVYVVENHKLPRVTFSLIIDNDPILEKNKVGYIDLTGSLLRRGTTNRSKSQLDEEVDFIGATLSTTAQGIFGSSLTKHSEKLLNLFTEVLYKPSFPKEELDKLKKQTISTLTAEKENATAIAGKVRSVLMYGEDHPYGEISRKESVEMATIADCKAYYDHYFRPDNAYLAIVGDIDKAKARALAEKYFGTWSKGDVKKLKYATPNAPKETQVAFVDRPAAVQSVISIAYPIDLHPSSSDVIKARVLNQILGGGGLSSRLNRNLREDKAFTYGAYSSLSSNKLVGSFNTSASVRNEVTDSAVHEFLNELNRIVNEKVSQQELDAAKASIAGRFGRSLERPQTVANYAINMARYNLPSNYYDTYLQNVAVVTVEDVQAMAKKYIKPENAYIIVVGKGDDVADKLKRFGKITYYDIYGKAYDPGATASLPEGFEAKDVIDNYLKAIGGKVAIEKVKDIKIVMDAEAFGTKVSMTTIKKAPGKFLLETNMGGNVVSRQVVNEDEVAAYQMGNKLPLDEKKQEQLRMEALVIPEISYQTLGVSTKLLGVKKVEGKDMYALAVTYPSGVTFTDYFDLASGLKERRSQVVKTPQGDLDFSTDYKDYAAAGGVLFPHTIIVPMGGNNKLNAKTTSIDVNSGVKDDVFK